MRWNGKVKGILKSLKVSGDFFSFFFYISTFFSNYYPRGELKNMSFFFVVVVS